MLTTLPYQQENHFYSICPLLCSLKEPQIPPGLMINILGSQQWGPLFLLSSCLQRWRSLREGRLYREWRWSVPRFPWVFAFGRWGGVGFDGSLTGFSFYNFFFFIVLLGHLARDMRKKMPVCDLRGSAWGWSAVFCRRNVCDMFGDGFLWTSSFVLSCRTRRRWCARATNLPVDDHLLVLCRGRICDKSFQAPSLSMFQHALPAGWNSDWSCRLRLFVILSLAYRWGTRLSRMPSVIIAPANWSSANRRAPLFTSSKFDHNSPSITTNGRRWGVGKVLTASFAGSDIRYFGHDASRIPLLPFDVLGCVPFGFFWAFSPGEKAGENRVPQGVSTPKYLFTRWTATCNPVKRKTPLFKLLTNHNAPGGRGGPEKSDTKGCLAINSSLNSQTHLPPNPTPPILR